MAIRLAKAFGSTPEAWAGIQLDYDMARAMQTADRIKVRRLAAPGRRGRLGLSCAGSQARAQDAATFQTLRRPDLAKVVEFGNRRGARRQRDPGELVEV